jgi:diguanylate cyclase (GGDEF)-like protein/PAS domain S-box-containing protein
MMLDGTLARLSARWGMFAPLETRHLRAAADAGRRSRYLLGGILAMALILLAAFWHIQRVRRANRDLAAARRAAEEAEERFRAAASNASDLIFEVDRETGALRFFGDGAVRLGFHQAALPATLKAWMDFVAPEDRGRVRSAVLRAATGEVFQGEYRLIVNGRVLDLSACATALDSDPGKWIGVAQDVTGRKRAEEQLAYQALHDPLTGLANRRLLDDRLSHAAARAQREKWLLAVFFIDLDNFKQINDTLGHAAGDEALRQIARRLGNAIRRTDTLARTGGDEFTLLVENVQDECAAMNVADKVRLSLAQPFLVLDQPVSVSASIGVSVYPLHAQDGVSVQQHADAAMYEAKRSGKNTVKLYRVEK